ncbi:MAG TPA: TonB-dependent receptor [Ferruginibacter sp.]|nr:TonB-dependent receptor [Ferruginibacter sp.]
MKKTILLTQRNFLPGKENQLLKFMLSGFFSMIFLLFFSSAVLAQQKTITGRVTNESGQPVTASVMVKGSTSGVSTDANGSFSIQAAPGSRIIISAAEYVAQEFIVGRGNVINASLVRQDIALTEVVVVGYGTQRKRDVTGAISKVNSETLLQTASHNVLDQLKGHAAGVNITSTSAVPGGGSQIRIRGNRTMLANTAPANVTGSTFSSEAAGADQADAPLVVVDGIPYSGNLNDISPNDITSLEILKDASATAIYGSRGAGGVILVTTKKGTSGKVTFNYSAYYGNSVVMKKLRVFNGAEYAQFKLDAAAGHSTTPGSQPWPLSAAEQAALAAGTSTDWQDLIYQNAPITNHNLSINGGSDKSKYSMSFGYFRQGGIIPNQDYKRFSIRSAMDHQLNKRIKIGLTTINSLAYQNTPGGGGVTNGLMRITPLAPPYNPDGSLNLQILTGSTDNLFNPLTLKTKKEAILARNRRLRTFNSLYGEVDIIKGLKYRINIGLDFYQDKADGYSGPGTYVNSALAQSQSTANIRNTEFWQYTIENLLFYNKSFKKHQIGLTALYSIQKSQSTSSFASGIGIPFDYMQNADLYQAASINAGTPGSNYFWERGLISYMGRATYGYDGRYNLTATVRRDGASVLSPGSQYYTYPAVAAAWNIMNEKFMSKLSIINNLRLRVGWGIAASQGINPYATLGGLGSSAYNYGQGTGGQQGGYVISGLPNKKLKWQSTSQFNFGLDFGILRNRISGSIEVYSQKTKDILLPLPLPPSNSGLTLVKNLGKTKGSGLELTINTINIKRANGLEWSTEFNYFFNREKITELANPSQQNDIGNGWFVGQPITVIYDYEKIGIWQTGDPGLATQTSPVQKAGDIRLRDVNGDNRITPDDRVIVGNFQPKFEMGMTNNVKFKRFDFSISMYARIGMKVVVPYLSSETGGANFTGFNWFLTGRNNQLKVDYWTPTNPTNKFPQPDALGTPQYSSTLSYVDGSFIKCRAINLGYEVPATILTRAGITSLRVYVSAVNPFVIWSPFVKEGYGPDPEGNGFGGGIRSQGTSEAGTVGRQVTVNANNPATRQFIFGLNLNF